jgi:hypothetical protein
MILSRVAQVTAAIAAVDDAFDALLSCEDTPANRERVNQCLHRIRMTYGITLRRSAVDELTGSSALLAQQSPAMRQRLSDLRFSFDYVQQVADRSEHLPEESGFEWSPVVAVGPKTVVDVLDRGVRLTKTSRGFVLAGPIDRACKDETLTKSFAYWERWQTSLPVFTGQVRREIEATTQLLAKERG